MSGPRSHARAHLALLAAVPDLDAAWFGVDELLSTLGGWLHKRDDPKLEAVLLAWIEQTLPAVPDHVAAEMDHLISDALPHVGPAALAPWTRAHVVKRRARPPYRGYDLSAVLAAPLLRELLEAVPRFGREEYPSTIVMDRFAGAVFDRLRDSGDPETARRAFAWIESLAQREDRTLDDLVAVCFLEGIGWEECGAGELLGPATRALIAPGAVRHGTIAADGQPAGTRAHLELLDALPEHAASYLGFHDVLFALSGWAAGRLIESDDASVAAVFAWYETALRDAPQDFGAQILRDAARLLEDPRAVRFAGPLTLERVTRPDP